MEILNQVDDFLNDTEPKVLEVLKYPDPTLRKVSDPVLVSIKDDNHLQTLIQDMKATLSHMHAIGLSAIQVGVPLKVMVVQDRDIRPFVLINPIIRAVDGEQYENEGCLSMPWLYTRVRRPTSITVSYFDERGELQTATFMDLLARAIMHEYEHFEGGLILDKLNKVQKDAALKKYKKFNKMVKRLSS